MRKWLAAIAVLTAFAGCIDVGHRSEIGCLVDMNEPGCSPSSPDGGAVDGSGDGGAKRALDATVDAQSVSNPDAPEDTSAVDAADANSPSNPDAPEDASAVDAADANSPLPSSDADSHDE